MTPVTLQQIADEWASKMLAGRESIPVDWSEVAGFQDEYVTRRTAAIREQAGIAAAAWARRCGRDPASLPQSVIDRLARLIARQIAATVAVQLTWDGFVVDALES